MTIDERLEYIATLQQSHDEQITKLVEQGAKVDQRIDVLAQRMDVLAERMDVLTQRTIQAMDAINRLANIA